MAHLIMILAMKQNKLPRTVDELRSKTVWI
jgi:hypothetical protein